MSAQSIDPQRIEQASKALNAAMEQGNRDAYSLAFALEAAGLLQSPETAAELTQLHNNVTGACLARWEEEQDNARLRLALASAQRGRRKLRARVTELEAASPWERAVAGLNALADADIAFWIEPDGHISGPFGDEHIEWDQAAARWRLVHDEEDDVHPSHPAPCRMPVSPDCTCPPASAEDPHNSPLHHDYATARDLPAQRDGRWTA